MQSVKRTSAVVREPSQWWLLSCCERERERHPRIFPHFRPDSYSDLGAKILQLLKTCINAAILIRCKIHALRYCKSANSSVTVSSHKCAIFTHFTFRLSIIDFRSKQFVVSDAFTVTVWFILLSSIGIRTHVSCAKFQSHSLRNNATHQSLWTRSKLRAVSVVMSVLPGGLSQRMVWIISCSSSHSQIPYWDAARA